MHYSRKKRASILGESPCIYLIPIFVFCSSLLNVFEGSGGLTMTYFCSILFIYYYYYFLFHQCSAIYYRRYASLPIPIVHVYSTPHLERSKESRRPTNPFFTFTQAITIIGQSNNATATMRHWNRE